MLPRYRAGRSELRRISDDGRTARQIATSCHFVSILSGPRDRPTDHLNVVVGIVACQRLVTGNPRLAQRLIHIRLHQVGIPAGHAVALPGVAELDRGLTLPAEAVDELGIESVFRIRLRPLERWSSHPGTGWQGKLAVYEPMPAEGLRKGQRIEQPSSVVGKPDVKPDAPPAPTDGRQKQRFSGRICRQRPAEAARQIEIPTKMSRI